MAVTQKLFTELFRPKNLEGVILLPRIQAELSRGLSAVETKRWAPERFAEVADTLSARGYKTVFFGGTMDEDMVQEAVGHMKTKRNW